MLALSARSRFSSSFGYGCDECSRNHVRRIEVVVLENLLRRFFRTTFCSNAGYPDGVSTGEREKEEEDTELEEWVEVRTVWEEDEDEDESRCKSAGG